MMKNITLKTIIPATALLLLSACATSQPALQGQLDPQFGSAVKANSQAHAVAPTAQQKANTFIPANPKRTALTREQYENGNTEKPQSSGIR